MSIAKGKAKKQREMKQAFSMPLFTNDISQNSVGSYICKWRDFHGKIFINFFSSLRKKISLILPLLKRSCGRNVCFLDLP